MKKYNEVTNEFHVVNAKRLDFIQKKYKHGLTLKEKIELEQLETQVAKLLTEDTRLVPAKKAVWKIDFALGYAINDLSQQSLFVIF